MNEEDGVIPKPLEDTTEMIYEHPNSKVEVNDVEKNILNPTKEKKIYQKIVESTPRLYPLAEIVL